MNGNRFFLPSLRQLRHVGLENGRTIETPLFVSLGAMVVQVHEEQSQGDEKPEGCTGDNDDVDNHGVPTC